VEQLPERRLFAERSGSFIGLTLLVGRLLDRLGAFGQVLLIAAVLGSTIRADLYFIASIIPLTIGNVVGEALAASVLARAARAQDQEATRLFSAGLWIAGLVLAALTAAYLVGVAIFVPRATPAGSASLLPWIAFAPVGIFFGLGAYCAAPLLHYERYVWPALRGAAATIVGLGLTAVVVALGGGVVWIGLAVSAGYGVALLLLVLEIVSIGRGAILAPPGRWALREVSALWPKLSALAGSGIIGGQVFVLIERVLTAPLGVGAVASISYARGVAYTPAILGQAIGAGVYPSVLRAHAADALDFVRGRFVSGLRLTLFVTAVSGAYLALYSAEIAEVLFGRDAVSPSSLLAVQHCLLAFSLALVGWMLAIYGSRLFGALNLFRGLLLQELVALVVYLAVVFPLRGALGVPGVALAYGIGQVIGALTATAYIARRLDLPLSALVARAAFPAVFRSVPVVLALIAVKLGLGVAASMPAIVVAGVGALTAAGIAAATLWPVDWPELDSVRDFLRRRFGVAAARE
jgi:putative peptidoglycan lipid II flippase